MKARVMSKSAATGQLSQAIFLCFSEASRNVTSFEVGHADKEFKVGLCGFRYLRGRGKGEEVCPPLPWLSGSPWTFLQSEAECLGQQL